MATKKNSIKRSRESTASSLKAIELPDVAIAAIASYKKQKEVSDFIGFLLGALERNSEWLNNVVGKHSNFRCVLMVGAGPNRFQIQETIYPSGENDIKLEVELKESEDYDKVAIAALLKLNHFDMDHLLQYIKTRLFDNPLLKEDLLRGKAMGIHFAVLRPLSEKQYRVMERIVVGSVKTIIPTKKRRRDDKFAMVMKKAKRVV